MAAVALPDGGGQAQNDDADEQCERVLSHGQADAPPIAPTVARCMLSVKQETAVSGTVRVFDYEIDIHGARVVAVRESLTAGCLSDGEIETNIKLLKDDLDAVAIRMKRAVRERAKKPAFER